MLQFRISGFQSGSYEEIYFLRCKVTYSIEANQSDPGGSLCEKKVASMANFHQIFFDNEDGVDMFYETLVDAGRAYTSKSASIKFHSQRNSLRNSNNVVK
jgi:hypothetical protein